MEKRKTDKRRGQNGADDEDEGSDCFGRLFNCHSVLIRGILRSILSLAHDFGRLGE
jgi:hypothetical protein